MADILFDNLKTPHDLRIRARLEAYPNRASELETVAAADEAAFGPARDLEHQMAHRAMEYREEVAGHLVRAAELRQDLAELRALLDDSTSVDADLAELFESLRLATKAHLGTLARSHDQLGWHADRLDSPYRTYLSLVEKWPGLWKRRP